jgi:predicted Fe-Mo cluster-binding NifX family protein
MPTTRAAFAAWENRIAPVFDTTRQVHVIEVESGRITGEDQQELTGCVPVQKPAQLSRLGIGTLVCGAISRRLEEMTEACGIRVIPFVSGDLREVIDAWLTGRLKGDAFAMPGCCGRRRRRRFRGPHSPEREDDCVSGRPLRRAGACGHRRQLGSQFVTGTTGFCVCPHCGHREPHQAGVPCAEQRCPVCGARLGRS